MALSWQFESSGDQKTIKHTYLRPPLRRRSQRERPARSWDFSFLAQWGGCIFKHIRRQRQTTTTTTTTANKMASGLDVAAAREKLMPLARYDEDVAECARRHICILSGESLRPRKAFRTSLRLRRRLLLCSSGDRSRRTPAPSSRSRESPVPSVPRLKRRWSKTRTTATST